MFDSSYFYKSPYELFFLRRNYLSEKVEGSSVIFLDLEGALGDPAYSSDETSSILFF
jgi:hypothetical protein